LSADFSTDLSAGLAAVFSGSFAAAFISTGVLAACGSGLNCATVEAGSLLYHGSPLQASSLL
jgi:hypothetical protein